ncbi:MAG: FAD-dependent oxidoreductase, partial [Candidatus Eremiobacteraeota bacterium]|nr:FAD-dependent oxidoreductase [Candidatus Eremiobacteraeota bacterium]
MASSKDFDLCVVGAGSAGYSAAETGRELGLSVALVDGKGPLCGLCILRGCMPAKTLLHSAEVAHMVESAPEVGVEPKDVSLDLPAVIARKRRIIKNFADARIDEIKQFPLFRGKPRFSGSRELRVDGTVIRAAKFVFATGSIISAPAIAGLQEAGYLTSDDFMEIDEPPDSIIVIGGGPVGCEFAQYLARLGAKTTLLQQSDTLLCKEDPDIGAALQRGLEKDGVTVMTGVTVLDVKRDEKVKLVRVRRDGKAETLNATQVLLASGRHANVQGFGLDKAGVDHDGSGVKVDEYLQTSNPDIFAAGDVLDGRKLLHVAVYQGR